MRLRRCAASRAASTTSPAGVETSIRELAETDQRADRQPDADRARPRRATGTTPASATATRARPSASSGFRAEVDAARRPRAHDRVDAREPRLDRVVHGAARGPDGGAGGRRGMKAARHRRAGGDHHRAADGRLVARLARALVASRAALCARAARRVGPLQAVVHRCAVVARPAAVVRRRVLDLLRPADQHRHRLRRALPRLRGPRDGDVAVLHGGARDRSRRAP